MQILEAASIIGLMRRTQSLTGRVGVVAGVLGLFRRDRVLAVGGFDPRMATEDIDLTWKLLLDGWQTAYEPRALVGMQVPASIRTLWAQRKRWARGQGEVLHVHLAEVSRWRNHRMWLLSLEALASLLWVVVLVASLLIAALAIFLSEADNVFGFALSWGLAISFVALVQMVVALNLEHGYDRTIIRPLLLGAAYPLGYWMLSGAAALHSETIALVRGPRERRVVWDIPRERLDEP
jgi:biofilm PGA synthesis N-glycosyltransferase PgaC